MLKHVDEENSEYPAGAEHTVLTKKKNNLFSNIAAATHRTNNLDV